jgi:hypothetical protein
MPRCMFQVTGLCSLVSYIFAVMFYPSDLTNEARTDEDYFGRMDDTIF